MIQKVYINGGLPYLNIAHVHPKTHALGPGVRSVIWVQGCPFRCKGCIAPDWIPFKQARLVTPEQLIHEFPLNEIDGITISGGEPMLQAAGLARFISLARQRNSKLSVICFTGFRYENLQKNPPAPGVEDLLNAVDVLIDGPYIDDLNDDKGLRGSSNQNIYFLTHRLSPEAFHKQHRQIEIIIKNDHILLVGIPPRTLLKTLTTLIKKYPHHNPKYARNAKKVCGSSEYHCAIL